MVTKRNELLYCPAYPSWNRTNIDPGSEDRDGTNSLCGGRWAGAIAGFLGALGLAWQASILVGWDGAALCYLIWTWKTVGGLDPAGTKRHANVEDASRRVAEAIVLVCRSSAPRRRRAGSHQGGSIAEWNEGVSHHHRPSECGLFGRPSTPSSCCDAPGPSIRHRRKGSISDLRYRSDEQADPSDRLLARADVVPVWRVDRGAGHQIMASLLS